MQHFLPLKELFQGRSIIKTENRSSKKTLREELKKIRAGLSHFRREEAAQDLRDTLLPFLASYSSVLSFASLTTEIDTSRLNLFLASKSKLLLPKTEKGSLKIYHVRSLQDQLKKGAFGLYEPIPSKCEEASKIEIALVPALGFDRANHRIGYGKGYYDRFLSTLNCPVIGIGFKEQLIDSLPTEPTDIPLTHVALF
ncbi:MAG: 5-formyltetrahydrofolate cyclo-ligase [Chlamydiales bacterium]|nr:5-formyltetrahydrofolate cyclo-ligase [Chlamydiales bacterium]